MFAFALRTHPAPDEPTLTGTSLYNEVLRLVALLTNPAPDHPSLTGTSLYNEVLRSCLPHAYPPTSRHDDSYQSLEDGSVSSTSSQVKPKPCCVQAC